MSQKNSEIRQIPKIAGTTVIEARVLSDTPHDIPDKALRIKEIGEIMNNFACGIQVVERTMSNISEKDFEKEHWEELKSAEEERILEAERLYQNEMELILRECEKQKKY